MYFDESAKEVINNLSSDPNTGLSEEEAKARLEKYGPNKLKEKPKKSIIAIFFSQMANPMIYVLFGAILITIGISIYESVTDHWDFFNVGDWPDVIIILCVIILNAIIGTVQEVKAQTSLEALKNLASPESTVIRNSKIYKIKASELVPGDIVILEEGDTIGADLRLITSINLKANESSLTGESVPVSKNAEAILNSDVALGDQANIAFMSTPITYGRGKGIVIRTGMDTEIGKIASALDNEEESETPLQKTLAKLSKFLGLLTIILIVIVMIVRIIWICVGGQANNVKIWIDTVLMSIALAVAAIPEGLAAVVTIVLSLGVQRMVKAHTIVRKLPAVETLGAVSVICSDKTGTLTQNKMTVLEAFTFPKYYKSEDFKEENDDQSLSILARGMSLCSNATVDEGIYGDPTEVALVSFANNFNLHKKDIEKESPRIDELPFDSVRKMMSTKHQLSGGFVVYTKGALDSILSHTTSILDNGKVRPITKDDINEIYKANKYFSDKALRVLALAYTNKDKIEEKDLIFVGLVAMIDPPREEAKPAVSKLKEAGITTVMITGDHKDTAYAIAKDLGIASDPSECVMGKDIDDLNEEQLKELAKTTRVFARVSPQNKVSIVKAFKSNDNVVAMTGDGVNDAPSLKAGDIGIAMGITGTDVAKGAADMILTDDNFASIEKAVEEGRGIFANVKKTVLFLLSSNFAEVFAMLFVIIIGFPSPLIAIHLLWVNLITDSTPAIALGMDPKNPDNMKEKPRDANESFFAHGGLKITIFYGLIITIAVLLSFFSAAWLKGVFDYHAIKSLYENDKNILLQAQTMAFTTLAVSELVHMIGMSDVNHSFVRVFKNKNWMMLIAFVLGIALQILVIEVPAISKIFKTQNLNINEWIVTIILSLTPLIAHEIIVFFKFIKKKIEK